MGVPPLGSLRSWVRDGLLAGALLPSVVLVPYVLVVKAVEGKPGPRPEEFLCVLVSSSAIGAMLALVTMPLAWWVARATWRVPLVALSQGPVVGACGAWVGFQMVFAYLNEEMYIFPMEELLLLLGFGAFAVGPPWVAYLAVRARGRSGLPLVAAALIWAGCSTALVVLLALARRSWLLG